MKYTLDVGETPFKYNIESTATEGEIMEAYKKGSSRVEFDIEDIFHFGNKIEVTKYKKLIDLGMPDVYLFKINEEDEELIIDSFTYVTMFMFIVQLGGVLLKYTSDNNSIFIGGYGITD